MSKTKKTQVRSANPEAMRATVYMPPELHESMRLATEERRKERRAEREAQPGPREYDRVTMSAVLCDAAEEYVDRHYPKFKAKPKRKAA